jgi:hypothetical protein
VTGKRRARPGRAARPTTPPPSSAGTTGATPLVIAPQKSRRQLRAERRQRRRRLGAAGIAGVVVVALVVVGAVAFGVHKATSGGHSNHHGQTTLMFSLQGSGKQALESALLAHDDSSSHRSGVELLVPARVLTQVCGYGEQQLGQILALPGGAALTRAAMSELLGGVTIDGSWVLTTAQLSRLVDEVGGIHVDVDTNVVHTAADGTRTLLIQSGAQRLTGPLAVDYATYTASGTEDAAGNLVRLQGVIDGLLAALPSQPAAIAHLVSSLGAGASSTLGATKLASLLAGLRADEHANAVLPTDLPTTKIDAGGAPAYRVDGTQTTQFVRSNLAASWPASARRARPSVYVQNGVGTPGLANSACARLTSSGYAFAGSGNAASFGHKVSTVLVFSKSIASAQLGDAVARALRLPASDVAVSQQGQNIADVVVILGKDFKP